MTDDISDLWTELLTSEDADGRHRTREKIIVHFLPLAMRVSRKLGRRLSSQIDPDDLISWGKLGLIDAVDRFDPDLGRFETFAATRIRGAILDELRNLDWIPRSVRARDRRVGATLIELQAERGCAITSVDAAKHLGLDPTTVNRGDEHWHSLDEPGRDGTLVAELHGDCSASVEDAAMVNDVRRRASSAVPHLDPKSRRLIALYYLGGRTLSEVGTAFGVTESRVCQLQGAALVKFGSTFTAQ